MRKSTINRMTRLMLALYGIWPGAPWVVICSRTYWLIALITDEFCHYRYFVTHMHSSDLFDLTDCLSSFLGQTKLASKLIIFWLNQQKLIDILTIITDDWRDCASCDVDLCKTISKAKLSDRIVKVMVTLHAITIVAYSTGIILADVDVTDRQSDLPLLLKMQLPINIHTPFRYKLLISAQFVHLLMSGCGAGLLNALLLTLVSSDTRIRRTFLMLYPPAVQRGAILHVGGQMDVLRSWLTELVPKNNGGKRESIALMRNKIIQKHQKIINFSEYIEDLYTYIALIQFVSNTILMCTLAFHIVTAIGNPDATEQITRSLLFYTVTNLEAFIFCFAGEYLINKSKAIEIAAYNCAWYELKPENSRILLFVILRAQKQLTLTVGKIMDLSLESFTNIMKASGSYLSVLLAMQ